MTLVINADVQHLIPLDPDETYVLEQTTLGRGDICLDCTQTHLWAHPRLARHFEAYRRDDDEDRLLLDVDLDPSPRAGTLYGWPDEVTPPDEPARFGGYLSTTGKMSLQLRSETLRQQMNGDPVWVAVYGESAAVHLHITPGTAILDAGAGKLVISQSVGRGWVASVRHDEHSSPS